MSFLFRKSSTAASASKNIAFALGYTDWLVQSTAFAFHHQENILLVETKKVHQLISDQLGRWGQITAIQWLAENSSTGAQLCFGTGRGFVLVYRQRKDEEKFVELSNANILPFNEPVESLVFNRNRVVISGHAGKVMLFQLDKNVWTKNINELNQSMPVIPRSVRFAAKGENVVVFGLESGMMMCMTAAAGAISWTKMLKSGVGNIAMSPDEKWLLVDNLAKGFDLYQYPHSSPTDSFAIPRADCCVQEAAFLEDESVFASGSDHGKIYLFSLKNTSQCLQKLKQGGKNTMIQVIDACSTGESHLIASGTSEKKSTICLWEKRPQEKILTKDVYCQIEGHVGRQQNGGCSVLTLLVILNVVSILVAVLWASGSSVRGLYIPYIPKSFL
ncbi:hypothetical protein HYPSUDRAFT_59398 [Hypholoma sublateritium FD-334 SS-4]|uniref:Anaphase-promoting complex subunit 4 WD40 domain-containing protein n=1 Tax=Hypholoma sublateritium (strain FD-334 SS-4) TaxID=945553 RepID=A0A0D2KIC9_HYPSF|nr:hypothetical protein HYPSUDRAFT_59398 [Hypholoma sublateritium FD-334 SS-4]